MVLENRYPIVKEIDGSMFSASRLCSIRLANGEFSWKIQYWNGFFAHTDRANFDRTVTMR